MNRLFFPTMILAAWLAIGAAPPAGAQAPMLRIASFQAGPVRCGALELVPTRAVAPLPVATAAAAPRDPIRFGLRIDREGRPLSIRRLGGPVDAALDIRDLAPALTAWRFEPGAGEEGCEIAFDVRLDSVEEADPALLYRYAALERMQFADGSGALLAQTFARLRLPGSTCTPDPVPSKPIEFDYQSIPEVLGGISYSFYGFDVDGDGRPVHVRLLSSSGNRSLDVAGDIAIGAARFPPQPRSGCLHYFYRNSTQIAPPPDGPDDFRQGGPACAEKIWRQVATHFRMGYPPEFIRRPAEGWVTFTYDIGPAGTLDNVRILASEPAARFGEEVLRGAAEVRVSGIPSAQHGCAQRVRFQFPPR